MKTKRHILETLAMLLALCFAFALVFQKSGTASGYPAGPTATPGASGPFPYNIDLPLVLNNFPPISSTSYYVTNPFGTDSLGLNALGTALGTADKNTPGKQDHLVVLDFGTPSIQGGNYGANMARGHGFISTSDIHNAAYQFAFNWYIATGSDFDSHLNLVIGTNTSGNGVNAAHAAAWAQAVDPLRNSFEAGYSGQISVTAGIDAEIGASPPWNSPSVNIAWVNGYIGNGTCAPGTAATEDACLYNFGNAQCPESGFGNCDYSWSMDNLWYVSYGARKSGNANPFVLPLPEIYNPIGSNAKQWQNMSLYGATCAYPCQPVTTGRSGPMHFVGALTELVACQQVETLGESCTGIDNDPPTGYLQLFTQLAKDSRTAQSVRWSTDIQYQTFP